MSCSPDISFEHFDPQFELGNLDTNGKPIRPRKKPGRKPNPPSPAQRKAQNRAAQRAFRERKRREMREAESTVKHCLYIRDQALGDARRLRNKMEEIQYENNYLKGQLLTLKLACIANRVDVPKLWDIGSLDEGEDAIARSRTKGIPQAMEIFLDKHRNIINLSQHHVYPSSVSSCALSNFTSSPSSHAATDAFVCSPPSTMVDLQQHEACSLLSSSPSSYSGSDISFLDTSRHQRDDDNTITTMDPSQSSLPKSPSPSPSSPLSASLSASSCAETDSTQASPSSHLASSSANNLLDISQHLSLIAPQLASHLDSSFFQQLLNTDLVSRLLSSPLSSTASSSSSSSSPIPAVNPASNTSSTDSNNDTASSSPRIEVNQWLQQQNLPAKHLTAVSQAIFQSKLTQSMISPSAIMNNSYSNDKDVAMDDILYTTEAQLKHEHQEGGEHLGSLDDSMQNNDIHMPTYCKLMDTVTATSLPERDAKTGLERIKTVEDDDGHTTVLLLSLAASKLKSAPPMKAMEALQYIRTVKNVGNEVKPLFKPTELQRMIPHDPRIDHIPGPAMRDLMILFQDFYNANELFELLVESSTFLGGDLGNPDCWFVPPTFLHRYWFLCPNHRPQRLDNLVDICVRMGQDMIKMMMERKAMYIEREKFAGYFPSDLSSTESLQSYNDQYYYQQRRQEQEQQEQEPFVQDQQDDFKQGQQSKNDMMFDAFSGNDFSIDAMMNLVNDLPRSSDLYAI